MTHKIEQKQKCAESNNDYGYNCDSMEVMRKKLQLKKKAFTLTREQIKERFSHLKKHLRSAGESNTCCNPDDDFKILDLLAELSCDLDDDYKILDLLAEVCEKNKCLKLQVETLRQKLGDVQGDIKVLRTNNVRTWGEQQDIQFSPAIHQREEMIEQLEKLNIKHSQLETYLLMVLDEKHELEIERDAFKCKAHRLNYELSKALSASTPVDVDALIKENKYLQERLQLLLEEKELTQHSLSKYKSMLDSKRAKGSIKLGSNSASVRVMTHKQVEEILQQGSSVSLQKSTAVMSDLRCLCTALLEALNDKTLALAHQKKANKILALRICELDSAVQSPTVKLLEGYTEADIDLKCDNDTNNINPTSSYEDESINENNVANGSCHNSPLSLEGKVETNTASVIES